MTIISAGWLNFFLYCINGTIFVVTSPPSEQKLKFYLYISIVKMVFYLHNQTFFRFLAVRVLIISEKISKLGDGDE